MSSSPKPRYSGQVESLSLEEQIRSLLVEGRILEAQNLFDTAGDLLPADSKLRQVLSPPRIRKSDRRDVDRSAEFHWLDVNSAKFKGQWVALIGESLVASAGTLAELLSQLDVTPLSGEPLIHHLD